MKDRSWWLSLSPTEIVCSNKKSVDYINVSDPASLREFLEDLSKGKGKVYHTDLEKWYNDLDSLRHDNLVVVLSKIEV